MSRLQPRVPSGQTRLPPRNPEAVLRRVEWTVVRRLDGLLHGDYRTLFRGFGLDLADLREYQYGDDVRHIDWNVTARLQVPHVREYHEDREITAWFLLDLSKSIDFGSQDVRKRSVSTDFVAALARILTRHGNRVGALYYDDKVTGVIPARNGRRQVLAILSRMAEEKNPKEEKGGKGEKGGETNLKDLLQSAAHVMKRRSLVFVVSDFISVAGWEPVLGFLAQRHEVIAVRLHDPLEAELPDMGMLVIQDAETGEQLFIDTHDKGFRKRFAAAAQRREESLRAAFRDAGVDALELSTGDDLVESVTRFASMKKRRKNFRNDLSVA
jgi:uncharacterized protein (DUF58 family)